MPRGVRWLKPILVKGRLSWPLHCEGVVTTPQTVEWRKGKGTGMDCLLRAKINYRGAKLCLNHAKIRALEEIAGAEPKIHLEISQ
jgi:hypothetical protein